MSYTFADMPDKTAEGVMKEVEKGLAIIKFYSVTTMGMPPDAMEDFLKGKGATNGDKIRFYMRFRNDHPELF